MPATVQTGTISTHYRRYLGSLRDHLKVPTGENSSTHVGSVLLDPDHPQQAGRAVVKCFRLGDKGWFNEYTAWLLGHALGVRMPPMAALLVGQRSDITAGHGPELETAARYATEPLVLWCTSALEPSKSIQAVIPKNWEQTVLKTDAGQRVAALDGWLGNCDRIGTNLLWWVGPGGAYVAIDHEKALFNRDWVSADVPHLDEPDAQGNPPEHHTHLIGLVQAAKNANDEATRRAANRLTAQLMELSLTHDAAWQALRGQIAQHAVTNLGPTACDRLLSFLDYRVTEDSIKRRLGLLA